LEEISEKDTPLRFFLSAENYDPSFCLLSSKTQRRQHHAEMEEHTFKKLVEKKSHSSPQSIQIKARKRIPLMISKFIVSWKREHQQNALLYLISLISLLAILRRPFVNNSQG